MGHISWDYRTPYDRYCSGYSEIDFERIKNRWSHKHILPEGFWEDNDVFQAADLRFRDDQKVHDE